MDIGKVYRFIGNVFSETMTACLGCFSRAFSWALN